MHVLAAKPFVGIFPTAVDCFLGRLRWNQAITAFANKVHSIDRSQCIADLKVVFRLEELHQSPLGFSIAQSFRNVNRLEREGIQSGVVHARGDIERCRDEVLHLIGFVSVALQKQSQLDHRFDRTARMGRDEVGNEVLLLAGIDGRFFELLSKELEVIVGRLAHFKEHIRIDMFGGNLQMAADVMFR